MEVMSPQEARAFLLHGTRTGKLATVRADGRPHATPIWFTLDGETLVFTIWHETVKAHNLARDPRAALVVDDETPPFAYVIVEGEVEVTDPPPDEKRHWTTIIARRYMGDALAEQFGKRNAVDGEFVVRLRPSRIIAHKHLAD